MFKNTGKSVHKKHQGMPPIGSSTNQPFQESDLGTETEAERQMKMLLENQLDTKITMKEHFKKHRQFTNSSTYTPLSDMIQGSCSLEKFKEVEADEEERQRLQRSGLTDEEIHIFLAQKDVKVCQKRPFHQEPSVVSEKLEEIAKKLKSHEEELSSPLKFANAKILSRHEMDLEKTLYVGCSNKSIAFNALIQSSTQVDLEENDPFKHVKDLDQKLSEKFQKHSNRKAVKSTQKSSESKDKLDSNNIMEEDFVYDPSVHHVIVPLEEEEVKKNKLSAEEIKSMPKFQSHQIGLPNKVLYLKNLHSKTRVQELMALFQQFESADGDQVRYRLLSGRMKGQAFVTFSDAKHAEKAFHFAHGYLLHQKPIIIEFGKKIT